MKFKSRIKNVGAPPGTYRHGKSDPVRVTVIEYDETKLDEHRFYYSGQQDTLDNIEKCVTDLVKNKKTNCWVNIVGVQNEEIIELIGKKIMDIHSLTLEDIVNTDQRPKYEHYDAYDHMVLRLLRREPDGISSEQISMVLTDKVLITFQEMEGDCFDKVRERLKQSVGRIRKKDADYLAYALVDSTVDSYFLLMDSMEADLDLIDKELLESPTQKTLIKIHSLKSELMQVKKTVAPMREMLSSMERTERNFIDDVNNIFLRDVQDHVLRILDTAEGMRDTIFGMMDIYMSTMSMRLNEVMKVLTIISTVFIPITFITSVYGMNFEGIVETHWKYGYQLVWILMLSIVGSLLLYFKNKKWL